MACIYKSKLNPNTDSLLYTRLVENFSTEEEVNQWFAYTETPEFIEKFGDWKADFLREGDAKLLNKDQVNEIGEPELHVNQYGYPYFIMKDGRREYLGRKILNLPHNVREALIQSSLFEIFGDNIGSPDASILRNINIDVVFNNTDEGSIQQSLGYNQVDVNDLKRLVKQRINQMGIKITEREEDFDPETDVDYDEVENTSAYDASSYERNSKDNASANMKFFLSFIPEMSIDEDGNFQVLQKKEDLNGEKFYYFSFYPFDQIYNKFQTSLADMAITYNQGNIRSIFPQMIEKLLQDHPRDASVKYATIMLENMDEYKQNEFVQAFLLHKQNFDTNLYSTEDGVKHTTFQSDRSVTPAKKIANGWNANFAKTKLISKVDGKLAFKKDLAQKLNERYITFLNEIRGHQGKQYPTQEINKIMMDSVSRLHDYLLYIGVDISNEGLSEFIYNPESSDDIRNLFTAVDNLKYVFQDISTLNNNDVIKDNQVQNILLSTKKGFPGTRLRRLAESEARFRKDLAENTVMGSEGKKYWIYSYPSYLSNKILRLKLDPQSELPSNTGFYQNSIILNKFRNNDTEFINNFKLLTFGNFRKENSGDEGTDNKGITFTDQLTDQINKTLGIKKGDNEVSVYYTPTPADKGRLLELAGMPFYDTRDQNLNISNETTNIMAGYILDELSRINNELVLLEDTEANKTKLYKDYHYRLDGKGKPYYFDSDGKPVGNAFKVLLFPEFSPFKLNDNLKSLFTNNKLNVTNEEFINNPIVRETINNALIDTIESNKIQLINNKALAIVDGQLTFPVLDKRISDRYLTDSNNNQSAAIERAVSDYVINSMISNVEFSKVFGGDYAFYKDLVDLSKRYPATYTDGIQLNLRDGDPANYTMAVLPNIKIPSHTLKEIQDVNPRLASAYANVNATDAQGWITLDRWKFVMERSNHWNPSFEEAYQRFKTNTQTNDDYKLAAQPIKGVFFSTDNGIPTYVKYSAAVLIPDAIKGTSLGRLHDQMVSQGVDEAVVVDGIKVGAIVPSDALNDNGKLKDNFNLNTVQLRNTDYKIQQDLRPKGFKNTLIGSQIKKIILSNLKLDQYYGDLTGEELANQFSEVLSDLSNKGLQELINSAGIDQDGNIVDKSKLTSRIIESLEERGNISSNLIDALKKEYDYDYIANYRQKIQNTVMSIINQATVKIKSNGGSFIQMSSWGIDEFEAEDIGIKWLGDNKPSNLKAPRIVDGKFHPGQVFISSNYIAKYIPNWKDIPSKDLKKIIDKKLLNLIGYRIPNQGMSSNDSLEVVGILPESYGDVIIPYMDITTKTGSDFDIDKMYVIAPNARPVYKNKKDLISELMQLEEEDLLQILTQDSSFSYDYIYSLTQINPKKTKQNLAEEIINEGLYNLEVGAVTPVIDRLEYITYNKSKKPSEQSKRAVENRMIELMRMILESPLTYEAMMSPLDSNELKDDLDYLHGKEVTQDLGTQFFSPTYQLQKKFDNMGGKSGIGITANQLTDHTWTQLKKIYHNSPIGVGHTIEGNQLTTDFSQEFDINNEYKITDVLSWFLTAYVDIAKDPYVSKGNHNEYTANTTFMLIRAGAPIKFINRLVGQEGIKELAKIDSLDKSRVSTPSFTSLRERAIQSLTEKYTLNFELANGLGKENLTEKLIDASDEDRSKIIQKYQDKLERDILKPVRDEAWLSRQIEYIDLFLEYKKVGDDLSASVLASKQDVNGGGKDGISALVDYNRVEEVRHTGSIIGFDSKFDNTFLGTAYGNSTLLALNIMDQLFITSNNASNTLYDNIQKLIDYRKIGLTDEKLGFELEKSYFAHILGQSAFSRNKSEIESMFKGDNSMYDRVVAARVELPDNYFLSKLDINTSKGYKFVVMDSTKNNSPEALNEISRSWQELLEHPESKYRQLGEDLIIYSFYQSGFRSNIGSFFEHIPVDKLKDMVEPYINEAKTGYAGGDVGLLSFIDKFFRHNWNNDRIVSKVSGKVRTNGTLYVKRTTSKPYVKTETETFNGTDYVKTVRLWKHAGYVLKDGEFNGSIFIPVSKLGFSEEGNNIYEYSSDIRLGGLSTIPSNNIGIDLNRRKQMLDDIDKAIMNGTMQRYDAINTTVSYIKYIQNNNRNAYKDLNKGLGEGQASTEC